MLKLDQAGAAGACGSCGALYARGSVFCWQCGNDLMAAGRRSETVRRPVSPLAVRRSGSAPATAGSCAGRRCRSPTAAGRRRSSAVALGFGLFVGVAIGPGAAGTLATGAAQIVEIPGFSGGAERRW